MKKIAVFILMTVLLAACSSTGEKEGSVEAEQAAREASPYLMFAGNCREAMAYYQKCLGGEIVEMRTFAESGLDVPEQESGRIYNSELRADGLILRASDRLPESKAAVVVDNFAIFVRFSETLDLKRVFARLSTGGRVIFPLKDDLGMLRDRFGILWMLEGGLKNPEAD
ncbi:MAG: VOC family protein [Candidatus Krumholzibacteriales bacterium]